MKIGYIIPALVNRGPIIVVKDIINEIIGSVDKVVVFYMDDIEAELEFPCEVVKISFKDFKTKLKGFDVIHSHMLRPDIMLSLYREKNVVKISTLHNYMYPDLYNTHGKIIAYITQKLWISALDRFNHVVCLTQDMRRYYSRQGLSKPNLAIVYNGRPPYGSIKLKDIDENDLPILEHVYNNYFTIGVSALLTPRKGIEQLVNILYKIPGACLIIIGDGPQKEELMELAKDTHVEDRCIFLGYKQDAPRYYKFFRSFAMPSRSEGFPLAMIEAASVKLPLLVSELPLFREILEEDEAVFVGLDDLDSMEAGINKLMDQTARLSQNAYKAYLTKFTSAIMGKKYLKVYEESRSENILNK